MLETVKHKENAEATLLFSPILLTVPSVLKPQGRNEHIFFQTQENCFLSLFPNYLFHDALLLLTSKIPL